MFFRALKRIYSHLFAANKFLRKINNRVLELALAAKGYGNHIDFVASGELFFVRNCLQGDDVKLCIDIGANVGRYSSLLCKETAAQVISFEPQIDVYNKLKFNLSVYTDRCRFVNAGVGSKVGKLNINFDEDNTELASFRSDLGPLGYVRNNTAALVDVTTLDCFFEENGLKDVDLIKIDAEGFEAEIFEGGRRVLNENKPKFIQLEMNWHQLISNTPIFYFFQKLDGYKVYQLLPSGMVEVDPGHPHSNFFLFSNFVFVREDMVGKLPI